MNVNKLCVKMYFGQVFDSSELLLINPQPTLAYVEVWNIY